MSDRNGKLSEEMSHMRSLSSLYAANNIVVPATHASSTRVRQTTVFSDFCNTVICDIISQLTMAVYATKCYCLGLLHLIKH